MINSTVSVQWDAAQDVRGLLLGYKVSSNADTQQTTWRQLRGLGNAAVFLRSKNLHITGGDRGGVELFGRQRRWRRAKLRRLWT